MFSKTITAMRGLGGSPKMATVLPPRTTYLPPASVMAFAAGGTYSLSYGSAFVTSISATTYAGGDRCDECRADRKSTRLNSSHLGISYAVFCLKKKKDDGIDLSIA